MEIGAVSSRLSISYLLVAKPQTNLKISPTREYRQSQYHSLQQLYSKGRRRRRRRRRKGTPI
jgi:hypothetical protein